MIAYYERVMKTVMDSVRSIDEEVYEKLLTFRLPPFQDSPLNEDIRNHTR